MSQIISANVEYDLKSHVVSLKNGSSTIIAMAERAFISCTSGSFIVFNTISRSYAVNVANCSSYSNFILFHSIIGDSACVGRVSSIISKYT